MQLSDQRGKKLIMQTWNKNKGDAFYYKVKVIKFSVRIAFVIHLSNSYSLRFIFSVLSACCFKVTYEQ